MVRQTDRTGAESCWDDDNVDSDEKCEEYLKRQQKLAASSADAAEDDDEEEDVDDEDDVDEDDDAEAGEAKARGTESDDDDEEDDAQEADADSEESDIDGSSDASEEAVTSRGRKMARKSVDGTKTKADHIREIIAAKKAAGAELRPRDIIAALEKRGVEVNASQVSITMRSMGIPPSRKGGGKAKAAPKSSAAELPEETKRATLKRKAPESHAEGDGVLSGVDRQLEAAADFIHEVGGYERAVSLLNMCNKVSQRI